MLTRSVHRLSPNTGGLAADLGTRLRPLLQRVCNTLDVADIDKRCPGASNFCPNEADDNGAPNSGRVRPTLELALHVCCMQTELIMFCGR